MEIKFRAIFYDDNEVYSIGEARDTYQEAEKDIADSHDLYKVFHYAPWTHAQVEKIYLKK